MFNKHATFSKDSHLSLRLRRHLLKFFWALFRMCKHWTFRVIFFESKSLIQNKKKTLLQDPVMLIS